MGRRSMPMPKLGETLVRTRDEAALAGSTVYFTGKLCQSGHLDWRYVSNMACRSCLKPPKPMRQWGGDGAYRYEIHQKLRTCGLPPVQHLEVFQRYLESCAHEWLIKVGAVPKGTKLRPDEEEDD